MRKARAVSASVVLVVAVGLSLASVHRGNDFSSAPQGSAPASPALGARDPDSLRPVERSSAAVPRATQRRVGPVSVLDYGAVGDGIRDDTRALQSALDDAHPGSPVVLPAGRVFRHTDLLHLRVAGTHVTGRGTLLATRPARSAVWVDADNITIDSITLRATGVTRRWDAYEQMKLRIAGRSHVTVRNVTVDGSAAAGIFVGGADHFVLDHVRVKNTRADGIHITAGSRLGRVVSPTVTSTGDDAVAVVSYLGDGALCRDIRVTSPTVRTTNGRGLSVVGGTRITYTDIDVADTSAAAVYLATEGAPYYTHATTDVSVSGGQVSRANFSESIDHGALVIFNGYRGTMTRLRISDLRVEGTRSSATSQASVLTDGAPVTNTTVSGIRFVGGPDVLLRSTLPSGSGLRSYDLVRN